jgi:hypothetical protein
MEGMVKLKVGDGSIVRGETEGPETGDAHPMGKERSSVAGIVKGCLRLSYVLYMRTILEVDMVAWIFNAGRYE